MSRFHEAMQKARAEHRPGTPPEFPVVQEILGAEASGLFRGRTRTAVQADNALLEQCSRQRWEPPGGRLFDAESVDAPGIEQFRTLRSRMYLMREGRRLSVVAVTSALPSEGKSLISARLAITFAMQKERRVLLIDADLRRPRLSSLLGAPSYPGLSDYVEGSCDLSEVLHCGLRSNLYLIPSGKRVGHPGEVIGHTRFASMIEQLRPLFDWIVLDTTPVLPVSDASMVAEVSDGVLMVVRAGQTRIDSAAEACREIRKGKLLGAVLNGVESGQLRYGYGYGSHGTDAER